jgi:hypothetical protein
VNPFLFLILCLFFSAAQSVLAIDTIQPPDALKHAGEEVYVEGVVASVYGTPKGVAFINLNEAYPHQILAKRVKRRNRPDSWPHHHLSRDPRDSDHLEGSGDGVTIECDLVGRFQISTGSFRENLTIGKR